MKRKIAIGAGAVLLLVAAFVGGRYSRPARVEERVKVETREVVKVEWRDRVVTQRGPVKVRVVTREVPGGERVIEKWIERGPSTTTTDSAGGATASSESTSTSARVSEGGRPGWAAGVSGEWDPRALSSMPDRLGLELDRRIVGTVWLGLRASSEPDLGNLRLGLAAKLEW